MQKSFLHQIFCKHAIITAEPIQKAKNILAVILI